jgi:hypothetical protein
MFRIIIIHLIIYNLINFHPTVIFPNLGAVLLLRDSSARFFGLGFFLTDLLQGAQISRLKGFRFFSSILARSYMFFDE